MLSEKKYSLNSSHLDGLVRELDGKRSGNGYLCKCPLHDDKAASLSLSEDNGELLWNCFAGCDGAELGRYLRSIAQLEIELPAERRTHNKVVSFSKQRQPVAVYPYYDENKVLLFEKLRYEPKTFKFRHQVNGQWVYSKPKCKTVLYNQAKLFRLKDAPVIICEGEKDADNLNRILKDDYVAVTNDAGSITWSSEHTKILAGRTIIICEDCDKAGRQRTIKLAKAFPEATVLNFSEAEVGEKGDVSDWLDRGHSEEELRERLKTQLVPVGECEPEDGEQKRKQARYEDYVNIFKAYKSDVQKDIFSHKLMYQDHDQIWKPLENKLGVLRSLTREQGYTDKKLYSSSAVADHLEKYSDSKTPRLLVDIPTWNKKDNIGELCSHIELSFGALVSESSFTEIVKEWMANLFRKLIDPTMDTSPSREFILILTGREKIGKDYWIRTLLCGLGQFFSPMSIGNNERDNLMQLHSGLVLNISEFDRTSKLETSFIKDIVTRSSTNLRASYGRDSEIRFSRTNFIASANMSDLLRDHGENTRYAIFELEGIKRDYTKSIDFSLQCLAQAQHLANSGYLASKDAWKQMQRYVSDHTPEDPSEEILDLYLMVVQKWMNELKLKDYELFKDFHDKGWAKSSELIDVLQEVAKKSFGSVRRIKAALIAKKMGVRYNGIRGFYLARD